MKNPKLQRGKKASAARRSRSRLQRVVSLRQINGVTLKFDDYMAILTCIIANIYIWTVIYPKCLNL